ncbi:MAG: histidine phosphatase family protein [Arcobacter sp.]|nr:histidine phosphatase family protein [Arcobacter sp.]
MKKLYLIRHAKSDWTNSNLDDFDRPLNKRGKRSVKFMSKLLKQKHIHPDLIISSPAYRARFTTKKIIKKINYKNNIMYNENLYEANLKTILEIITFIEDENDEVFIVAHNPGLNLLAYNLLEFNENLPTCSILEISFDCSSWREIKKENAKFVSFEYPKKYKILDF